MVHSFSCTVIRPVATTHTSRVQWSCRRIRAFRKRFLLLSVFVVSEEEFMVAQTNSKWLPTQTQSKIEKCLNVKKSPVSIWRRALRSWQRALRRKSSYFDKIEPGITTSRAQIFLERRVCHGEKCQSFRGKLAYVTIERVSTKNPKKNGAGQHTAFFTWRASFAKLTNDHVSWCLFYYVFFLGEQPGHGHFMTKNSQTRTHRLFFRQHQNIPQAI